MRAVIWAAVSSKAQMEQDKVSLEDQERICRKWCVDNGHDVVAVLKVEGHSRFESTIEKALSDFRNNGVAAYDDLAEMWDKKNFDVLVTNHAICTIC